MLGLLEMLELLEVLDVLNVLEVLNVLFIYSLSFHHLSGYKKNSLNDQLPVGLTAQLVRALHRYRRGHGFESR